MRIALVTHYFPPEIGAPQARLSELATCWTAAGDDVVVLTGMPNHPTGVVPPGYRHRVRCDERVDGYRVVRTWVYATPNEGVLRKTLGHLSFMVTGPLIGGRHIGRPDVVVVSSPTFFSILSAWFLARRKRARLVVEVRDLWPAVFVQLGVLTNRFVIRALEAIELAAYRAADAVVVVSEGFRDDLVRRGVPAEKVHVIRNGVDLDRFASNEIDLEQRTRARARLGATDQDVLVLYIGAHGISHDLPTIARAAALLHDRPIHVAFVGEGAQKAALAETVRSLGLDNVTMLPGVPREQVPALVHAADICLVTLRDIPLFSTFIPSKIFEYFGAGRAVIGAVRGEPAAIVGDGGGMLVEPGDEQGLATAIAELADDPERRQAMGERARRYVEAGFDRRVLADTYREILAELVGRPG